MNTTKTQFHVSSRALEEKKSEIRRTGYILGNVFGLSQNSQTIQINAKQLGNHLKNEGENGLLYLVIDEKGKEVPALIEEIQRHPVTREVSHISFKRVNLNVKVEQEVPVRLEGEVDIKDATVLLVRDNLEIEALPADLPEELVVHISGLTEVGQELRVSDLQYDRSKITVKVTEEDENPLLAIVQEVKEDAAEEQVAETTADGETTDSTEVSTGETTEGETAQANK